MVRTLVVAPAQVQPHLLRRDVAGRVIERRDVRADAAAKFLEVEIGILDVPAHAEVGAIDLQHDAGLGHGLVFVAHRFGDGLEIGVVILVVVVAEEQRHHAGGGGAHEAFGGFHLRERRVEIVGVGPRRGRIAHADRRVASRRFAAGTPGIAEHALRELGEFRQILVDEGIAGAAEAVEPVLDVGGVARLRQFAVVDQIDAGIRLFLDDFRHRGAHARGQAPADRPARLPPWRTSSGSGRRGAAGCRCGSSGSVQSCVSFGVSSCFFGPAAANLRAARPGLLRWSNGTMIL